MSAGDKSASRVSRWPATVSFSAGSYGALAINLVQSLFLARILEPAQLGIWLTLLLLLNYGQHYHLGLINSVNRQIPLRRGQGREDEALAYARRGTGLLLWMSAAWVPIALVLAFTVFREHRWGALAIGFATVMEVWINLAFTFSKTHSLFGRVGAVMMGRSLLNLGLLPVVVWLGLNGVYGRVAVVSLLALAVAWRVAPLRPRPRFGGELREFFRDGMPLLAVGMVFSFQINMDKMLIAAWLGTEAVGRYALALLVLSVLMVVPGVVGITAYPGMLRDFGASGRPTVLRARVIRSSLGVFGLGVAAALLGLALLSPFVHAFLPKYAAGIPAARWILPGIVLLATSVPSSYFLQTVQRQREHLIVSIGALALHVLLVWWVVRGGGDIREIAMATSASYTVYAVALFGAFLQGARDRNPR